MAGPRIFCILARKSPAAVVFRRGPTRIVQLLSWDRSNDTFKGGQWLKGRIYEHRADLSPAGKYLVYFAANQKPPHYSWTAVSKPPDLTALAFWPNGSTWGGGGLFVEENKLQLNGGCQTTEDCIVPDKLSVDYMKAGDPNEEGFGICTARMKRDGWLLKKSNFGEKIYSKMVDGNLFELHMSVGKTDGRSSWYENIYRLVLSSGKEHFLEELDRADFDSNGDFLFARCGSLYRLKHVENNALDSASELIDLKGNKFANVAPDKRAKIWD